MKNTHRNTLQLRWSTVAAVALLCLTTIGITRESFAADAGITPSTVEVVPYQAGGYRYSVINYATQTTRPNIGFEQPEFNDSAWSTGQASMGSGGYCDLQNTRQINWPVGTEIYVRRKVIIPAGATNIRIMAAADNDILAFFDGAPLGPTITHEDCPVLDEFRLNVEPYAGTVTAGEHTLAFYIKDRGVQSFFDMRLLVDVMPVQKLQYRLNGVGAFADVVGTLTVAEGTSVEFQALSSPSGAAWPTSKPMWSGTSGASGTGASKSVTFNTVSTSATDYKTVTAQTVNTVTANVVVAKVAKLQYRMNGAAEYSDVPNPLYIVKNAAVEFKVIGSPTNAVWPQGKPLWGGSAGAAGTGDTKSLTFSNTGSYTITSECGNTKTANIRVGELTVSATSDHLEADGRETATIGVFFGNANDPFPNQSIALGTGSGTLSDTTLTTDANGNAVADVDTNGNGTVDPAERLITLTAPTTGALTHVTADVKGGQKQKAVLFHKIVLSDFSSPKLLTYDPESSDTAKQNPQFTFTISDQPAVAANFTVTYSIHQLEGHDPIATKTETLAPGTYTRSWSDFFYAGEQPVTGKVPDPGMGIYPFQIEAAVAALKPEQVENITDKNCSHADWKATKGLEIKQQPFNAYAISYDEETGKTVLSYIFDVYTAKEVPVAPSAVSVNVYDPDLNVIATVLSTEPPVISGDGHTFTYLAEGEVNLTSAGDYHFVVEAKNTDDMSQGQDAGKWALEQNSRMHSPTYAVFGGYEPPITLTGSAFSGTSVVTA